MAQRMPLETIDGNRGYKKGLSIWDRAQISAFKTIGLSNSQIGGSVFCTRATVQSTLRLNALRNEGETKAKRARALAAL